MKLQDQIFNILTNIEHIDHKLFLRLLICIRNENKRRIIELSEFQRDIPLTLMRVNK